MKTTTHNLHDVPQTQVGHHCQPGNAGSVLVGVLVVLVVGEDRQTCRIVCYVIQVCVCRWLDVCKQENPMSYVLVLYLRDHLHEYLDRTYACQTCFFTEPWPMCVVYPLKIKTNI